MKYRFRETTITGLLESQWWEKSPVELTREWDTFQVPLDAEASGPTESAHRGGPAVPTAGVRHDSAQSRGGAVVSNIRRDSGVAVRPHLVRDSTPPPEKVDSCSRGRACAVLVDSCDLETASWLGGGSAQHRAIHVGPGRPPLRDDRWPLLDLGRYGEDLHARSSDEHEVIARSLLQSRARSGNRQADSSRVAFRSVTESRSDTMPLFWRPPRASAHGAVIAAEAVVYRDVPPYAIVRGNPAQVVGFVHPKSVIEELLVSRWWETTAAEGAVRRDCPTVRWRHEDETAARTSGSTKA